MSGSASPIIHFGQAWCHSSWAMIFFQLVSAATMDLSFFQRSSFSASLIGAMTSFFSTKSTRNSSPDLLDVSVAASIAAQTAVRTSSGIFGLEPFPGPVLIRFPKTSLMDLPASVSEPSPQIVLPRSSTALDAPQGSPALLWNAPLYLARIASPVMSSSGFALARSTFLASPVSSLSTSFLADVTRPLAQGACPMPNLLS